MNYELVAESIRKELKNYIKTNHINSLVIGISGGIDSCLCAALARPVCDELGIPLIGRSLPMSTNQNDEIDRASLTGRAFCTDFKEINLQNVYALSNQLLEDSTMTIPDSADRFKIRKGNIKARLRMIYLYNLASQNNGMVLSTDNYTELLLGFWTLHGDVGDYGMIQNLWKTEVYNLAEYIANYAPISLIGEQALRETINAMATDGLGVTNLGDLGQIIPDFRGNSRDGYKMVDQILQDWLETPTFDLAETSVIQRHLRSEFKRNNPVNIQRSRIIIN